jgi:hypothetical protein
VQQQHALLRAQHEGAATPTTTMIMPHRRVEHHDLHRRLLRIRSVRARRGMHADAHLTLAAHL